MGNTLARQTIILQLHLSLSSQGTATSSRPSGWTNGNHSNGSCIERAIRETHAICFGLRWMLDAAVLSRL